MPLEEHSRRLRHELDAAHKKILTQIDRTHDGQQSFSAGQPSEQVIVTDVIKNSHMSEWRYAGKVIEFRTNILVVFTAVKGETNLTKSKTALCLTLFLICVFICLSVFYCYTIVCEFEINNNNRTDLLLLIEQLANAVGATT